VALHNRGAAGPQHARSNEPARRSATLESAAGLPHKNVRGARRRAGETLKDTQR